ncbi:hypothetical protein B484DRAFT_447659 [Ochromonadaceae sp. CCMP2298]|nr:hypothetical protein B484DRAFT_447659 [Ochromonadaceae sp. CCMP2298]|mmetsp:Transcript_15388/g.33943  ORF Transcript_15388/g.33943 Transcript_15388/m.33943 type:complete len:160 (-) Transcript_15388:98-577(-)|eukprot:CAMPEP_0173203220 /NCGR_PEP_ID=MMETSP1141-20130122/19399_1 /TAXON_ID=483371 /ORGANISM="non described non described, Strain CCMP2298" /LENGTH=159 /DNA_ID=CAMNT_0014128655 /DNA_START=70 /DNA_END=549 /DNA_ORIENTATION=+
MSLGKVMQMYKQMEKLPFGKTLFSYMFSFQAPYFLNIRPIVNDIKHGHASVTMKQRWAVQNHIQTVHAIAVCNLVEMSMGLVAEASIPAHLRWLPMGMDVTYKKKAMGTLTASSTIPDTFFNLDKYPGMVKVPVSVINADGVEVTYADVRLWISEKPKK